MPTSTSGCNSFTTKLSCASKPQKKQLKTYPQHFKSNLVQHKQGPTWALTWSVPQLVLQTDETIFTYFIGDSSNSDNCNNSTESDSINSGKTIWEKCFRNLMERFNFDGQMWTAMKFVVCFSFLFYGLKTSPRNPRINIICKGLIFFYNFSNCDGFFSIMALRLGILHLDAALIL